MDRNEYLTRCRECATITAGIIHRRWQAAMPEEMFVYVGDLPYIPYAYRIWFDSDGNAQHEAQLLDSVAWSSFVCVDLKNVKGAK